MNLEQQVCSLELAKKLKELGVAQDNSHFIWMWDSYMKGGRKSWDDGGEVYKGGKWIEYIDTARLVTFEQWSVKELDGTVHDHGINKWHLASAFTVAELGEMLPANIKKEKRLVWLLYKKEFLYNEIKTPVYTCEYSNNEGLDEGFTKGYTEADARAKMLIYLLENNLITL